MKTLLLTLALSAMCGAVHAEYQASQLEKLFDELSAVDRDAWQDFSHCRKGRGAVWAQMLPEADGKKPAVRFFCKAAGRNWNTPWYGNEALKSRDFVIHEFADNKIRLLDWNIAGTGPRAAPDAPLTRAERRAISEQGMLPGAVSAKTLEKALRSWIDNSAGQ